MPTGIYKRTPEMAAKMKAGIKARQAKGLPFGKQREWTKGNGTCYCGATFTFKKYANKPDKIYCGVVCHMKIEREKRRKVPSDRELLYRLYVTEKKSLWQIAQIFGCTTHKTVSRHLILLGIPLRKPSMPKGTKHHNPRPRIAKNVIYGFVEDRDWAQAVLKRDKHTCQLCGAKGRNLKLQADHIKPRCLFPELAHDLSNGRALCVPCHKATPTYGAKVRTYAKTLNLPPLPPSV